MILRTFHLHALRVDAYLLHDLVDFLKLKVNDVVHHALSQPHMSLELVEVEVRLRGERIHYV